MKSSMRTILGAGLALLTVCGAAHADAYADAVAVFKKAGESREYFSSSYAYALFPTVGEAGFILGGALGKGRVYQHGRVIGDTTVTQISAGLQAGGKAYSQVVFFEDKRALDEFKSGTFEFAAGASAIAITAAAGASAGTNGVQANASGTENNATTVGGGYNRGMAVFTIAKGGLMYSAAIAGQKFSFTPRAGAH